MKQKLLDNKLILIGLVMGGIAGFLYWKFVGCNSGTCMISSKPLNATAYFSIIGALVFQSFKKTKKPDQNK